MMLKGEKRKKGQKLFYTNVMALNFYFLKHRTSISVLYLHEQK